MQIKSLYINFNTSELCDQTGAKVNLWPSLTYYSCPTWELNFGVPNESGFLSPVDLTEATAWHAAVDTDFDAATDPMVRTLSDKIDASEAASGILKVELDTATSSFFNKINGKEKLPATFEIRGLDASDKVIYDYHFKIYALGAVDPMGGDPLPVVSGGVTMNDVYAVLPTVNDPIITLKQGTNTVGSFTLNQTSGATFTFSSGGGGVSGDYIPLSAINAANGVAGLDSNGKVLEGEIPLATGSKLGGITVNEVWGVGLVNNATYNNALKLVGATNVDITGRTSSKPIIPTNLNYAVKAALTDTNHITLSASEQATVQSILNVPRIRCKWICVIFTIALCNTSKSWCGKSPILL